MFEDDARDESFEDTVRSIARELGQFVERALDRVEAEEFANAIGMDPTAAREWVDSASAWLREHAETVGDEVASHMSRSRHAAAREDALRSLAPHPLDMPGEEQGLALAALASGRWMIEPGTEAIVGTGDGPGPSDAIGVVRELRVRDWITAGGEITIVGRHALGRWLEAAAPR